MNFQDFLLWIMKFYDMLTLNNHRKTMTRVIGCVVVDQFGDFLIGVSVLRVGFGEIFRFFFCGSSSSNPNKLQKVHDMSEWL